MLGKPLGKITRINKTVFVLLTFYGFQMLCLGLAWKTWQGSTMPLIALSPLLVAHVIHSVLFAMTASDSHYHYSFWKRHLETENNKEHETTFQ